jgi:hypothetical protein
MRKDTSSSVIGPPTLDFGPNTSTSRLVMTASSGIVFMTFGRFAFTKVQLSKVDLSASGKGIG